MESRVSVFFKAPNLPYPLALTPRRSTSWAATAASCNDVNIYDTSIEITLSKFIYKGQLHQV